MTGKQYNPERSLDPFWDQVIAAHDTLILYPQHHIEVEHKDRRAELWMEEDELDGNTIVIKTWMEGVLPMDDSDPREKGK